MSINLPCNTFIVAVIALTILKTRNKLCGDFFARYVQGKIVPKSDKKGRAPKLINKCKGSCRGIANMGAADASRRFAY